MVSLYRWLLQMYPAAYRREFGEEMMAVLREAERETWQKGGLPRAAFYAREAGGLFFGGLEERLRSITGADFLAHFHFRRITMRSEFRFPKATVALMAVILAAVVVVIEKAKAISASVPDTNPQVGPISPAEITIVPTLLLVMVMVGVAGVIGWALLYAPRRSGMQRFTGFKASGGSGI